MSNLLTKNYIFTEESKAKDIEYTIYHIIGEVKDRIGAGVDESYDIIVRMGKRLFNKICLEHCKSNYSTCISIGSDGIPKFNGYQIIFDNVLEGSLRFEVEAVRIENYYLNKRYMTKYIPYNSYSMATLGDTFNDNIELKQKINYKYGLHGSIKKVIFNNPATIVLWKDGTKTVVKCCKDDVFDKQTGLAMCILKHYFGKEDLKSIKKYCEEDE